MRITACGLLMICLMTVACQSAQTPQAALPLPTSSPPPPATQQAAESTATSTPALPSIGLPDYLPDDLLASFHLPPGYVLADDPSEADLSIERTAGKPLSVWIYALVAPFPTLRDELSSTALFSLWRDGQPIVDGPQQIIATPGTISLFEQAWGPSSERVIPTQAEKILDEAWQSRATWAIIPFEEINPRWKVITVQGQNPLHKQFDYQSYQLTVAFGLAGDPTRAEALDACCGSLSTDPLILPTNRQADRLTTVVVTGVTALVRATAAWMAQFGVDYPAEDIGPWLREADILHINNEVPFAEDCPNPNNWEGLAFCSQPRMIQLLESIGTDVVELSGDHFADWGSEAMVYTLDLYQARDWKTYGGGSNIEAAKEPALFEHNGNRIAFLGCNAKEIGYATAGPATPGAIHCDWTWLEPAVRRLVEQGYQVIVTFQHQEYYEVGARPQLQVDFRRAAQAGAAIVSGSQAHLPQAMEFANSAFLHYGLGNLFFDQVYSMETTDQAFIDRHVFYQGRHIATELLTIRFIDYARSRPMTAPERDDLLRRIFAASGWSWDN